MKTDKGCCYSCPAITGVKILGSCHLLFILVMFILYATNTTVLDEIEDKNGVITVISIITFIPYMWVWRDGDSKCARLMLYTSGIFSAILWTLAYTVIWYLQISMEHHT